jgi:hypothetical protein
MWSNRRRIWWKKQVLEKFSFFQGWRLIEYLPLNIVWLYQVAVSEASAEAAEAKVSQSSFAVVLPAKKGVFVIPLWKLIPVKQP